MSILKPTCEELHREIGLELVSKTTDHICRLDGVHVTSIYYRKADKTFWMANYRLSHDRKTNELREGLADIKQAEPYDAIVTRYRTVKEDV